MWITFEGPEGAGKSSQIARVAQHLESKGHTVVTTREPGGTALGAEIRKLLLHQGGMHSMTEYLLYSADRAEHLSAIIAPSLERGHTVLCDRWLDSALAYQGYGRQLNLDQLRTIGHIATNNRKPDRTFLLDLDPAVGLARFTSRDRLESEPIDFHHRVRQGYLALAQAEPERFVVIDASQTPDHVFEAIVRHL